MLIGVCFPGALPGPHPAQVATEGPPGWSGPTVVGQQVVQCRAALPAALPQAALMTAQANLPQAALMAAQAYMPQQATLQQAGRTWSSAWVTPARVSVLVAICCGGHAAGNCLSECLDWHCSLRILLCRCGVTWPAYRGQFTLSLCYMTKNCSRVPRPFTAGQSRAAGPEVWPLHTCRKARMAIAFRAPDVISTAHLVAAMCSWPGQPHEGTPGSASICCRAAKCCPLYCDRVTDLANHETESQAQLAPAAGQPCAACTAGPAPHSPV